MNPSKFNWRVLALLASAAGPGTQSQAQIKPPPTPASSKVAELVRNAFGAIWMDSDMEDADIEEEVRAALRAGASPNARDEHGDTLLIQAIENNRESVVRLLLRSGADVNSPDKELGDTPLIRASYTNDTWANENGRPLTALVRMLLQRKAAPNRRNKAGETALTLAASLGHSDIVGALLKAGADFRLPNKAGLTPLKLASTPVGHSIYIGGSFPELTNPNDAKQTAKEMREHQAMVDRMLRAEEKRVATGRAQSRRLLLAAGAKK